MRIPIVSNLVSRFKKDAADSVEQLHKNQDGRSLSWGDDTLELRVGTLLADKESKSFGTVQAVTMTAFQDELGDLWHRHEKNILLIAETTIDRMLGKGQTSIREDELTWLLVTPDLTISEAEVFAKSIAVLIGEKLVGARFEQTEDTDPTPMTGLVDLSSALTEDGSIDRSALQLAVSKARATMAAQDGRAKREKIRLAAKEKHSPLKRKTEQVSTGPSNAKQNTAIVAEGGLRLSFWPVWSSDSQSIDTFVCRPLDKDGSDPFSRDDPALVSANAITVVRAGVAALHGMINDGVRAKLVIPIPLNALLAPSQRPILQAFSKLEEAHRFLYLRPEIVRVPHSVSTASILTARDLLRPLARDVGVLTDLHSPNAAVLAASKVMIGCSASEINRGGNGQPLQKLKQFRTAVKGRQAYVLGLPNSETVKHAAQVGFDEIGGIGLRAPINHRPDSTEPLPTQDLLNL